MNYTFGKTTSFKESFRFMTENMSVGIKLMIANLMGMLLVGSGRIIVQLCGNIERILPFILSACPLLGWC